MSFPEFPRFPRTFVLRHLDVSQDKLARDMGFPDWTAYVLSLDPGGLMPTFETPTTVPRGRKASMVWTRDGEDVATIGMHFLHRDGSEATDFVDADEATVNAHLLALWAALKGTHTATTQLDRIVWHNWGVGVRRPNPATNEYLQSPAIAGTHVGTDPLPPQDACSVTFKTSARRNWGRVYWPATIEAEVTEGRFIDAYVDAMRTAFGTLIDACATDNLPLVVWCPRHAGALLQFFKRDADHPESAHTLNLDEPDSSSFARTVDQVQVDDLVDVIRSRRFAKASHYATHTLGA